MIPNIPTAPKNPYPNLFTDDQYQRLLANGEKAQETWDFQPKPVVKLFTPDGAATWILSDIYPGDKDIAFGLCDLGMWEPELGDVSLIELSELRGKLGLPIERDRHFTATKSLVEYADDARKHGGIRA